MSARQIRVAAADERTYIVARTRLAAPGRPYVVSECTPGALVAPPPGLESLTRAQMLGNSLLKEALAAWDEHDDSLARRERDARSGLGRGRSRALSRTLHPSFSPKTMRVSGPLVGRPFTT